MNIGVLHSVMSSILNGNSDAKFGLAQDTAAASWVGPQILLTTEAWWHVETATT